jgi:hypothetical protein
MDAARNLHPDAIPLDELGSTEDSSASGVVPSPSLDDLSAEASGRIIRYIVTSTLERGVAPTAVVALYADLAGDDLAVRYADRRFMLREVPPDWSAIENRVLDLEASAHERGLDLAAAWRRATSVAMDSPDPFEQLSRLAGMPAAAASRRERSIFDDPEDLDELESEDFDTAQHALMSDRLPELVDLSSESQQRIRRFAIEERLEHGLPPIELLDMYRDLEFEGDDRARQYLDRIYVDHAPPPDWIDLQSEAGRIVDLAEARGQDAGRLFADLQRASPGLEPLVALRLLLERLTLR